MGLPMGISKIRCKFCSYLLTGTNPINTIEMGLVILKNGVISERSFLLFSFSNSRLQILLMERVKPTPNLPKIKWHTLLVEMDKGKHSDLIIEPV